MLQAYVLSISDVSDVCCKCFVWLLQSRSRCCICCNACTRMLQASISNVSSVFSYACCKCVYLDVAYVSHICCNVLYGCCVCFAMVFKCFHVFLQVFQTRVSSVSRAFRRMFQMLHLDVSKVHRVFFLLVATGCSYWRAPGVVQGADATWAQVGRRPHVGSGSTRSAGATDKAVTDVEALATPTFYI